MREKLWTIFSWIVILALGAGLIRGIMLTDPIVIVICIIGFGSVFAVAKLSQKGK